MAAKKVPISYFVKEIGAAYKRKDGYIMGATGQDPKKWAKTSWWFTQYTGAQRTKALYWRENAKRVWDCNGLAEGIYKDYTGVDINTKARYNYSSWCGVKAAGLIPGSQRVAGAAVFWGDSGKPSTIHHVGYLYEPVNASNPKGDWYIIEARGVNYGVVKTKLESRKPNYWGLMTVYFDYSTNSVAPSTPEPAPASTIDGNYVNVRHGSYYIRTEASTSGKILGTVKTGQQIPYLGETKNGWYKVETSGKVGWISSKCGDVVMATTPITTYITVKNGSWHVRAEANSKSKSLGIVKAGDKVEYRNKDENGWKGVKFKGTDAWITSKAF